MADLLGGLSTGSSLAAAMVGLIGGLGLGGLLRGYIRHRTRMQSDREWSARTQARTTGLIRLAGGAQADVRIDERDRDGHRIVELHGLKLHGSRRTDGSRAA